MHYFPGALYAPWYETRDHIVPWRHFWHLYGTIPALEALQELTAARGAALGIGMCLSDDESQVRRQLEARAHAAFGLSDTAERSAWLLGPDGQPAIR